MIKYLETHHHIEFVCFLDLVLVLLIFTLFLVPVTGMWLRIWWEDRRKRKR